MIPIYPWVWTLGFFLIVGFLPLFVTMNVAIPNNNWSDPGIMAALLISIVCALWLVIVWRRSSSSGGNLWLGFESIAATLMSGCAPITAFYMWPAMLIVYVIQSVHVVVGFRRGREYSQRRWIGLANTIISLRT